MASANRVIATYGPGLAWRRERAIGSAALPDLPDRSGLSPDLRRYRAGVDLAQSLHEFTAADPDGNLLRVFYDFAWETRQA